jgi:putative PIN family toxin of toxin-antitoxin system
VRIVLDTNVFISGVFFRGPPFEILNAWRHRRLRIVASAEILEEYRRVSGRLGEIYPGHDIGPLLLLFATEAEIVLAPALPEQVCEDPSDDMFLACAIAAGCPIIVSGDRQLQRVSGYGAVEVVGPRRFVERFLVS